jgi:hypothetical protein
VQVDLLIRSSSNATGFKGVKPNRGRFQAQCQTCRQNHGTFGLPEEAAQAYLQHHQQSHEEGRVPPCPHCGQTVEIQDQIAARLRLHLRSDKSQTKVKGVYPSKGRYPVATTTLLLNTPEEAADAYLHHWETEHREELEKERAPPLQVQEHLLMRSGTNQTGFKRVGHTGDGAEPRATRRRAATFTTEHLTRRTI